MAENYSAALDLPTPETIEEAVRQRNAWIDSAAMFHRNAEYYRDLLDEIGAMLGPDAYTSDDGSIQDSVLRAKLPELTRAALKTACFVMAVSAPPPPQQPEQWLLDQQAKLPTKPASEALARALRASLRPIK